MATGPGYRRRIRIVPRPDRVTALLEDDIHAMAVTLHHAGGVVGQIETATERMPWDTCPGAAAVLVRTFAGQPLEDVTVRRDRKQNCTHLHDLAVFAAAHAGDAAETTYDIAVSDPVEGWRELALARNGAALLSWREHDGVLIAPDAVAGRTLLTLRDWIATLDPQEAEAARILQWAALVAHGRTMPLAEQSRAAVLPPNCYTFQPERANLARRTGEIFDFSMSGRVPGAALGRKLGLEEPATSRQT